MDSQNYANHRQFVPMYHIVLFFLQLAILIGASASALVGVALFSITRTSDSAQPAFRRGRGHMDRSGHGH